MKHATPTIDNDMQAAEPMLEALIRQHGEKTVTAHLPALIGQTPWQNWQRLANAVKRIANRIRKER